MNGHFCVSHTAWVVKRQNIQSSLKCFSVYVHVFDLQLNLYIFVIVFVFVLCRLSFLSCLWSLCCIIIDRAVNQAGVKGLNCFRVLLWRLKTPQRPSKILTILIININNIIISIIMMIIVMKPQAKLSLSWSSMGCGISWWDGKWDFEQFEFLKQKVTLDWNLSCNEYDPMLMFAKQSTKLNSKSVFDFEIRAVKFSTPTWVNLTDLIGQVTREEYISDQNISQTCEQDSLR